MDFAPLEQDGLVYASQVTRLGVDNRELTRAVSRGQLMRLRQGVYVASSRWQGLSARDRQIIRICATSAAAKSPLVLARESAAAVWGIPLETFPDHVTVLERWKGGGRSEPGVVRTSRAASAGALSEHAGFTMTNLARTAIDVTRGLSFAESVPILDWVISVANPLALSKSDLVAEALLLRCGPAQWRAIEFASEDSGSMGESETRAAIHQLGYPRPRLQRKFTDELGNMYSDFYFEDDDAVAEFDGKTKYTLNKFTKGDPAEVLWREKKREDRLRRQVRTVIRILTEDVKNPHLLDAKLRGAGIRRLPRRER